MGGGEGGGGGVGVGGGVGGGEMVTMRLVNILRPTSTFLAMTGVSSWDLFWIQLRAWTKRGLP